MTFVPAQEFAARVLANLVDLGVEHVFVSPGSRSQALAIAAGQLADAGLVKLHVRLDERSSGFQALGVGKATETPAIVITTSGTAVANLHPAALEAHHAGVPMILLTADRPAELRGVGANQTTNQVGIFGDAVGLCLDVPAPDAGESVEVIRARAVLLAEQAFTESLTTGQPVQLNLAFREPLSSVEPDAAAIFAVEMPVHDAGDETTDGHCGDDCQCHLGSTEGGAGAPDTVIDLSLNTVVIAGDGGDAARWYCTGLPLLAEPSSGVRDCPEAIAAYPLILRSDPDLVASIEQVLVFGKPTLTRTVQALVRRDGVRVLVDSGRHDVFMPTPFAEKIGDDVAFEGEAKREWLDAWRVSAKTQLEAADAMKPEANTLTRRALVEAVYSAAGKEEPIILGASSLIREADIWAPNKVRQVYANRGLAGIDGTVATAMGVAHGTGAAVRLLLGDLTLLHDAGSLALAAGDENLNLQIVVGNDHGGSIFESLEVAKTIAAKPFEQLFKTPQAVDISLLARAYGWQYHCPETADELAQALKTDGLVIIEVNLA